MKNILICFLISSCLHIGYSQTDTAQPKNIEKELSFYLLDVEHGLSNNVINGIEQDSLGFIWIATPGGLNRYDGTQFIHYQKDDLSNRLNISDNFIEQIRVISEGKLLLATNLGANIYDPKYETFEVLNKENGLMGNTVSCLTYGTKGEYILGINYRGVQIVDKGKIIKTYRHEPDNISSLSSNEITCVVEQGDSLLWVGTANKGLNKINYKTKKITRLPFHNKSAISSTRINTLYPDNDGNLWIGSKGGLGVITTKGDTLKLETSSNVGKGLSGNNVLCFEEDKEGRIWIGTRNSGLNILHKSEFLLQKPNFSLKRYLPKNDGSSIYNRTVSSLKMDRDGNMWIGTSTGLNFVNPQGEPVKLLKRNIASLETLGHNRIGALTESSEGKIWIGTDGAGLDLFDPKTGKFEHYLNDPKNPSSLSNNYIISLYEDTKNRLWVGTYQGGLNKRISQTKSWKHYLQGEIQQGSDIRVIFEDRKGGLWVGTNRGGLFKYVENIDKFEFVDLLGKIDIRDISEDQNGYLWMATYGDGVLRYHPENDELNFYNSTNTDGFKSNIIFSILVLSDGDILIGTRHEGLIRFNPQKGTVLNFTENDGLSNNTVSSIVMENEIDIWLGTFKGISHYNSQTHDIYNLNNYNNIQQSEFAIGSALKSKSGTLYFGGDKGLNVFNPANLDSKKETYPIIFEKLEVFNKKVPVSLGNEKGILDRSISYQDHIVLDYNQTLFSIDYATLRYPFVKNINYSYRLDDYHDHWINTNTTGKVNLTNIPQGSYTLNVRAKFGSGEEVSKQIFVTINPPFWKTPLAYVVYLIVLITGILGIMKYYSERIKLINSLLFEKKQRQLEHDFNEERTRFFTSFSHELKTPLTLILAPLEDWLLELKTKKSQDRVKLIYKNAKVLLQSINQLLEYRKAKLGLSKIDAGEHNLSILIEQWVHNYDQLAKKRHILLTYNQPEKNLIAFFDPEKLHIIVNNLLSNAFKHTLEKGKIDISLSCNDSHFKIKVKDNGSGIHANELEHIFDWYYQSGSTINKSGVGIGLSISKIFIELHNGGITVESEPKNGSTFCVSIPRDKSLFMNAVSGKDLPKIVDMENSDIVEMLAPVPELLSSEKIPSNLHINEDREVILLIDDNPDIINYLNELLEDDYDLLCAEDGKKGMEKALLYIPDLIISDVMMPNTNGIDLCNILKEHMATTHIPIILLTAKGNFESIKVGYEEGADDYIVKPFNSQILKSRIRNLLDNRKHLRNYFLKQSESLPKLSKEKNRVLDREKKFLSHLELVILENLDQEKTNVESIAQEMGMSRTSLFRKIKAITGLNINQYVTRIKIDRAAELIEKENFTISQASYEVGYSNVKYFRKLFKDQFGKLPSDLSRKNNI